MTRPVTLAIHSVPHATAAINSGAADLSRGVIADPSDTEVQQVADGTGDLTLAKTMPRIEAATVSEGPWHPHQTPQGSASATSVSPSAADVAHGLKSSDMEREIPGSPTEAAVMDDDWMFSFKKERRPVPAAVQAPGQASTPEGPDHSTLTTGPAAPLGVVSPDVAADKAMLRRQLQELDLLAMGWQNRLAPGTTSSMPGTSSPAAATHIQMPGTNIPLNSTGTERPAPFVAATCSEDEEEMMVWGGASGSDTDDTDELLAKKSRIADPPQTRRKVGAASTLAPGTVVTSLARVSPELAVADGMPTPLRPVPNDDWMFGFSKMPLSEGPSASAGAQLVASGAELIGTPSSSLATRGIKPTPVHPLLASSNASSKKPAEVNRSISNANPSGPQPSVGSSQPVESILNMSGSDGRLWQEGSHQVPGNAQQESSGLQGTGMQLNVDVQRVQHVSERVIHTGVQFANVLPSIPPDFKLTYM